MKKSVIKNLGWITLAGAGMLALDIFAIERIWLKVKKFTLGEPREGQKPVRMVQLSDLHLRQVNFRYRHLANTINRLAPQVLLLTGDVVDTARDTRSLKSFLTLLDTHLVKLAVLGNWDYKNPIAMEDIKQTYHSYGVELLLNEHTVLTFEEKEVAFLGVDDLLEGKPDLDQAMEGLKPEVKNRVLLSHCPAYRNYVMDRMGADPELAIDYVFSGHTHGGQVNLYGYTPYLPAGSGDYVRGWFTEQNPPLYVSQGFGTSTYMMRFNSRSEITVFDYYLK